MANLLVMMEFYRGTILSVSLEALGQARRLGTALGLTVYALVPLPSGPTRGEGDITAACGLHGADKVVFLTGESLASEGEMRFQSFAPALVQACTQLTPRLFLFGDTPAARDVAPRLAVRLGAAYLARGAVQERDGRLLLFDVNGQPVRLIAGDETTGDDFGESESVPPAPPPVVLTIPPGRFAIAPGVQDADILLIASQERDLGSDVTPVTMGGFVEESMEPQPLDVRLGGSALPRTQAASWESPVPTTASEPPPAAPALPPLWTLQTGDETDAGAQGALYRIAVGPDAEGADAEYALVVPAAEVSTSCQALRAQLLLPAVRPPVARRGRSGARGAELSSGDGWAALENTETGESDAKADATLATDATPPPSGDGAGARAARRPPLPLSSAWDGAPEPAAADSRDGVPEFELENADTAPVPIQAPGIHVPPVERPPMVPLVRQGPRSDERARSLTPVPEGSGGHAPSRSGAPGGKEKP